MKAWSQGPCLEQVAGGTIGVNRVVERTTIIQMGNKRCGNDDQVKRDSETYQSVFSFEVLKEIIR